MIRVLLDTNVVLDALLDRTPWEADAKSIIESHADGAVEACVSASAITDVFYIARKIVGRDSAWDCAVPCLDRLFVLPVGGDELRAAIELTGKDLEDNLHQALATVHTLDAIVTRDLEGFAGSKVKMVSPSELVQQLGESS